MKKQILTIALLAFGVTMFAQKKEIKKAIKANEKENYSEALTLLNSVKSSIDNQDNDLQFDYYLAKANAEYGMAGNDKTKLMSANASYKMALDLDPKSAEALNGTITIKNIYVQNALDAYGAQDFKGAMTNFNTAYEMSPTDTIFLYNAANMAISAQDFDSALKSYVQLNELGYEGREEEYFATNKETGDQETFSSLQERDLSVQSGQYIKPENKLSPSKRGEIAKNIALIYISQDKNEEAIEAMEDAKLANPDDITLVESEADMYYRMGNMAKYKELMEQVVAADPTNPTLYYNLGVSTAQLGDNDGAVAYYKKAIELNPEAKNAMINIAAVYLGEEAPLVEEMNSLGTSSKDYKRYDELVEQRSAIYRKALPYLKDAVNVDPTNVEAIRTMMNIYYQLDEEDNAKAMKAQLEALEGN